MGGNDGGEASTARRPLPLPPYRPIARNRPEGPPQRIANKDAPNKETRRPPKSASRPGRFPRAGVTHKYRERATRRLPSPTTASGQTGRAANTRGAQRPDDRPTRAAAASPRQRRPISSAPRFAAGHRPETPAVRSENNRPGFAPGVVRGIAHSRR